MKKIVNYKDDKVESIAFIEEVERQLYRIDLLSRKHYLSSRGREYFKKKDYIGMNLLLTAFFKKDNKIKEKVNIMLKDLEEALPECFEDIQNMKMHKIKTIDGRQFLVIDEESIKDLYRYTSENTKHESDYIPLKTTTGDNVLINSKHIISIKIEDYSKDA